MTSSRTTPTNRTALAANTGQPEPLANRRLWRAGLLAVVVAAVANATVFALEKSLLALPMLIVLPPATQPAPLPWSMVIGVSVVAAIVATLLFAILVRITERPRRWFQIIAVIVLLASFWGPFSQPVDLGTQMALAAMHIVAALAIIAILTHA